MNTINTFPSSPDIPEVGARGRMHVGSDVYPVTCTYVSLSGKSVRFKVDEFKAGPGHDYHGVQKWEFEENPHAREERADWSPKRQRYQKDGCSLFFTGWDAYQDPSF